jgi:hypothetical protein
MAGTIIKGGGTAVFNYATTSTYRRTGTLENLTIDGTSNAASGLVVAAKYAWTKLTRDVIIQNCNYAVKVTDAVDCDLVDTQIDVCTYGVAFLGTAALGMTTCDLENVRIGNITNQGLTLSGNVLGGHMSGGIIELCGAPAINFHGTAQGAPTGFVMEKVWIEEDGTNEMILFDSVTTTNAFYGPKGCVIRACYFHCGSNVSAFNLTNGRRNIFTENICSGSGTVHFTITETNKSENNLILNCVTNNGGHWVVSDAGTTNQKTNVAEAE